MGEQRRQVGQGAEVGGDRHLRLAHREDGAGRADAGVKGRDEVGAGADADAAPVHRRDDRHRAVGDGTDRRLEPHQVEEELNEPLVVVGAGPGVEHDGGGVSCGKYQMAPAMDRRFQFKWVRSTGVLPTGAHLRRMGG